MASKKQKAQQKKFKNAVKSCKGESNFKSCVRKKLE